ncbi:MAG: hypothetical protein DHS80DRAFT_18482 [Piptocephalis tieghemiana]|nr:MAG: hypothetical protein DHS80DRAFT_18482 [Piptocephalis tieghemiana]
MSRFVRASKFRHVYGTPAKRDGCYDNLRISTNAWDTNVVKANPKYLSVNWSSGGGGSFAVLPLDQVGRQTQEVPLFNAHSAPVLDTDFSPFNDQIIASAGEDAKIMLWNIPEEPMEESITTPAVTLTGHRRSVGHVLFHPTASNVLASSSADHTIKLWDVEHGVEKQELDGFGDVVQSLSWNYNGSLLATTCRDKKIRIHDVRSNTVIQSGNGHQGIKSSRVTWLGEYDRVCTTGFSRTSDRQLFLWDTKDFSNPMKQISIDSSSGNLMPFYDVDTKMLYLAGKAKSDGNIRYYELENDDLFFLSEYKSTEPQRGMAFLPKRALNVNECEIARAFKVTNNMVEPISFTVPRKADFFQADLFPPAVGDTAPLTAEEFFSGKDANPILIDLEKGFTPTSKPALQHVNTGVTSGNTASGLSASNITSSSSSSSSPSHTPARTPSPVPMDISARSAPTTSVSHCRHLISDSFSSSPPSFFSFFLSLPLSYSRVRIPTSLPSPRRWRALGMKMLKSSTRTPRSKMKIPGSRRSSPRWMISRQPMPPCAPHNPPPPPLVNHPRTR